MVDLRWKQKVLIGAILFGIALTAAAFEARPASGPGQSQEQVRSQGGAQDQGKERSQGHGQKRAASESQPNPGATATIEPPSLGELAREQRAEREKNPSPHPQVFTNDNLPKSAGGLSIVGPPPGKENTSAKEEGENHAARNLRRREADLREQLETHQRELAVLQQKLGENQVQYYPNPNDILHQEYSRGDINRLTSAIDEKKKQVEADQQALSDAQDALAREGLSPREPGAEQEPSSSKPDLSGVKKNSEDYWRLRFKAAREVLARAQEQQKLAEDELALLQSQQAHEMANGGAATFDSPISAKQSEIESKRAAVAEAQRDLDSLEQEFKQSGSPQAWGE